MSNRGENLKIPNTCAKQRVIHKSNVDFAIGLYIQPVYDGNNYNCNRLYHCYISLLHRKASEYSQYLMVTIITGNISCVCLYVAVGLI